MTVAAADKIASQHLSINRASGRRIASVGLNTRHPINMPEKIGLDLAKRRPPIKSAATSRPFWPKAMLKNDSGAIKDSIISRRSVLQNVVANINATSPASDQSESASQ